MLTVTNSYTFLELALAQLFQIGNNKGWVKTFNKFSQVSQNYNDQSLINFEICPDVEKYNKCT